MTVGRGRYVPRRRDQGCRHCQGWRSGTPFACLSGSPVPWGACLSGGAPPVPMPGEFELWSIVITRPVRRIAQAAVVTTLVAGAVGVSTSTSPSPSPSMARPPRSTPSAAPSATSSPSRTSRSASTTSSSRSAGSKVADGQKIVVRYGRKLTVTVDGSDARLLDHRHHGGGRPAGAGHPCRLRQAVGLALADAGPPGPGPVRHHAQGRRRPRGRQEPHRQLPPAPPSRTCWASSRSRSTPTTGSSRP